ncbi:putative LRR receptor-like serine/threonine-protein kinase [Vitis vinifera]|uniref:non-specific serine/threonine protein kinase n=1 Tax=Vitis vinifera TaxID=29760 RepID=A0A438HBW4_VITVI|nr:putative LRR receptor-like serine/threonine-protein kinase [Vitis vinifera]
MHINCGGKEVIVDGNTTYEDDTDSGGPSKFYQSRTNWAFSSTGHFMDDDRPTDSFIGTNVSRLTMENSGLYTTARLSALSLTYYGFCLENGNYTVKLHFAEITFTDDKTYSSLGRRLFDVYVQDELVLKDFNIEDEAGGVSKEILKYFTAVVTNNTLEIRFYWAGKGTTGIPVRGVYGPLISAISVDPVCTTPLFFRSLGTNMDMIHYFLKGLAQIYTSYENGSSSISVGVVVGIVAWSHSSCLPAYRYPLVERLPKAQRYVGTSGLVCWHSCQNMVSNQELKGLDLQTGLFTLRQIKAATNNFDAANKIGEGGFGSVYKDIISQNAGRLIRWHHNCSEAAFFQIKTRNREFVNEIGMISALQHPHLVKLYGCCIEGNQLLLIYEYMENNSLARALFGPEECQLQLDWPTRHRICVGIARGLAYLHEESRLKIVHRDIKATNVLLDKDLNPKISDFGLAKLDEEDNTHISTRIAGTYGRSNTTYRPKEESIYLLDQHLQGWMASSFKLEAVKNCENPDFHITVAGHAAVFSRSAE